MTRTESIKQVIGNLQRCYTKEKLWREGISRNLLLATILKIAEVFEGVSWSYNDYVEARIIARHELRASRIDI